MKKFTFVIALMLVVAMSYAQKGVAKTVTASEADTNKGAETDYLYIPNASGFTSQVDLAIQILCTDDYGGDSDGLLTIEGSTDGTSYVILTNDVFTDMNDDSISIADGVVAEWIIPRTHHYKYRIKAVGTSGDTTLFTPKYRFQEIE